MYYEGPKEYSHRKPLWGPLGVFTMTMKSPENEMASFGMGLRAFVTAPKCHDDYLCLFGCLLFAESFVYMLVDSVIKNKQ